MKTINNKIANITKMFDQYNELKSEQEKYFNYYDDKTGIDSDMFEKYMDYGKRMNKCFADIRRNIRSLAAALDFELVDKIPFDSLISTWERIFNEIHSQWKSAMKALHQIGWMGYSEFIKNA